MGVRSSWRSIWNPAILEIEDRGITILEISIKMGVIMLLFLVVKGYFISFAMWN